MTPATDRKRPFLLTTHLNQAARQWAWLALLLGAILLGLWLWLGGLWLPPALQSVTAPIITDDLNQHRANTAPPTPQGEFTLRQTFVPRWDGLREIELLVARRDAPEPAEDGRLHLELHAENGVPVAAEEIATRSLNHNQTHLFRFPVQRHSAGRQYILQISGNDANPVSVWGYNLDGYGAGGLTVDGGPLATAVPDTPARDLRFITRYQLTGTDAFIALGTMVYGNGPLLLLALFFLPLPGCLWLLAWPQVRAWRLDFFAWWGLAAMLGVALWPLIWYFLTLAGGRWQAWSLWLVFGLGWLAVFPLWFLRRQTGQRQTSHRRHLPAHLLTLVLLLLILATRFLAVRDLSFPPWVDASRHGLVTAVIADSGQFLTDYHPYLPVDASPYHFGFHTLAASLEMMTGHSLPRLLLFLGQLLNGLLPLTVYTAVSTLTRRRFAAHLAMFLVGLPFFFPGYYLSWGRLTQLTAMFIMPGLLALTWLLIRGGRRWRGTWPLVGALLAGLFLIHFRVFVYFLPFAPLVWMVSRGRNGRPLFLAVTMAAALIAPRVVQLLAITRPARTLMEDGTAYNQFPLSYVQSGWESEFLWLAGIAFLLLLGPALRRRRWIWLPLLLAGWIGILFLLISGNRLGLPLTSLVNVNSLYIILFLPLAIFLAITADRFWRWLRLRHWLLQLPGYLLTGSLLAALLLFGVRQQISILNPQTVLAQRADAAGLAWVRENVPETAVIAVSSWNWLGDIWAGSDGGAWIVPLTGRTTTTPPIDHVYNRELLARVREFNEKATAVADWGDPGQADWLRQQEVTHIYVGSRGGYFDPAALARNPKMTLVYDTNGVFVFEIRD